MRRFAQVLAVAGAAAGLGLTALPATAGTLTAASRARLSASKPTPAQLQAAKRAQRVRDSLSKKGAVTGIVLGQDGAPESGVCVRAIGLQTTRTAFTRPDGEFVIGGLPFGDYRIEYRGCSPIARFTAQWYGGLTRASATRVRIASQSPVKLAPVRLGMIAPQFTAAAHAGTSAPLPGAGVPGTGIGLRKFALAPAYLRARQAGTLATVTGTVTNKAGHPVRSVCVLAVAGQFRFLVVFGQADTAKSGKYTMRVPPGRYRIDFLTACSRRTNYAPQLWKGASSTKTATLLRVRPRQRITGIDAVLGVGAQITGRLRPAGGGKRPLGGMCVTAVGTGGQRLFEGGAISRADGTFRLASLATGRYRVSVTPQCRRGGSDYLPVTLPKAVAVTNGKTTAGVVAALKLGGTVTGKVKDANGHLLAGICANVGTGRVSYQGRTAKNGTYHIQGIAPGKYKVFFSPGCRNNGPYAPLLLPGQIQVAAGKTTAGVDAVLAFDGSIAGTVTGPHGKPLEGVCVASASSNGNFGFAVTKADGSYQIKNAPAGNYQVEFIPGGSFSSCGLQGNFLPVSATATVTSNVTTTLNAVLPNGAVITGVVTGAQGKPLGGICVISTANPFGNALVTKSDGSYRLDQLFTGSYLVGFEGGCGNTQSVAPVAYKGDPTFFGPRPISVIQGKVTPGINAQMRPGGTVTGRVTDQAGHAISGTCVFIEGITGAGGNGNFAVLSVSQKGRYGASNLPPGQYAVFFSGQFSRNRGCAPSAFADQEFMGRGIGAVPDLVSVPGGAVTSGVNAVLEPSGRISGVIRTSAGRSLPGFCVTADNLDNHAVFQSFSERRGKYTLVDLSPGRYNIEFSNCGGGFFGASPNFANQWYKGKSTQSAATTVIVTAGKTTTGIDAALTPGGSLAGQVVFRPNNRPVAFVCVFAFTPDFSVIGQAVTDRRGNYVITGLSNGIYIVEYQPCSFESALAGQVRKTPVHVTVGHTVRGVRAVLDVGGTLSGRVAFTGTAGTHSAPGTCVEVQPLFATGLGSFTATGLGGKYQATNLAPGPYRVLFGDPACSSDWPTLTAHTSGVVYVTKGHDTPGVDATLAMTGAISGTVRGPSGHALAGICAIAQHPLGGPSAVVAVTGKHGYRIAGLQPGNYKIEFTTGCGASGFGTRWYKNSKTLAGGTTVTVKAGQTTAGIDGKLPRG